MFLKKSRPYLGQVSRLGRFLKVQSKRRAKFKRIIYKGRILRNCQRRELVLCSAIKLRWPIIKHFLVKMDLPLEMKVVLLTSSQICDLKMWRRKMLCLINRHLRLVDQTTLLDSRITLLNQIPKQVQCLVVKGMSLGSSSQRRMVKFRLILAVN